MSDGPKNYMKTSGEGKLASGDFEYDHTLNSADSFSPIQRIPENKPNNEKIEAIRLKLKKTLSRIIYDFFRENKNKSDFIDMLFRQFSFGEDFTSETDIERRRELLNYYVAELASYLEDTNLGITEVIDRLNMLGILKDEFNSPDGKELLALAILRERNRIQSGLADELLEDQDPSSPSSPIKTGTTIGSRILDFFKAAAGLLP